MTDHHHDHDDARFQPDDHPRLGPLSKLDDFEVADGYRDPRGWRVLASDGTDVGKVHDLIVDTGTMHTRYLDVRLDHDRVPSAAGRPTDDYDVLVPIGAVQLESDGERVSLPSITPAQLVGFPVFNHGEITTEYENAVLGGAGAAAAAATAAHATTHAAERTAEHAADRVTDRAVNAPVTNAPVTNAPVTNAPAANTPVAPPTRPAAINTAPPATSNQPVTNMPAGVPADLLQREDVTVERRAVDPREATDANTKPITNDNEVRIPLVSEETVTRPMIREEIVVRRHRLAGDRTIDDQRKA